MDESRKTSLVFDLWISKHTDSTSFATMLYQLIAKADRNNRGKLSLAFPDHVEVWLEWYNSPDENEFFRSHGIGVR